ncbi:LSm family protein [Bacillus solitudinis]|uniref:hypothetical protein n=1 Tax=Bacillus solitudinis TaxID=2014074 RepID=UPI000C23105B|nr:hypothetical protein [Bacillus solitudinis]
MEKQIKQFQDWIKTNRLIRVVSIESQMGRKTIIGRLLLFDPDRRTLLVYDDDQKEVINLQLNEIDSIETA